ncbi:MAG: hypothetical protein VX583_09310 [Bdellovibrionota bacterium]|tara:strand:+ start:68579 stop:69514 length:936 start_codon:yes stop_codon:yes gene_type:complete
MKGSRKSVILGGSSASMTKNQGDSMAKAKFLPDWFTRNDIKPYVYIRNENSSYTPGVTHPVDWFNEKEHLQFEPTLLKNLDFGEAILSLEGNAFEESAMPMPKWVFYDCAIMPGIVSGFAMKRSSLPEELEQLIKPAPGLKWVPISCFIAIPTAFDGQWIAHNLTSANKFLKREDRLKGLGYLSKAFGLWYANIKKLCGVTQWTSPAIKLHSCYGDFELITAYTPIHTHKNTFTYKSWVDSRKWFRFFTKEDAPEFHSFHVDSGLEIDPTSTESMKDIHIKLEAGNGPFFLSEDQIRKQKLDEALKLYMLR